MPDHIKMPDTAPIVRYVVNGVQTVFEYPFPIFASEDLKVYFDGAPQYAGYDISDAGNTSGGTITFDQAPVGGVIMTLERRLPLERMTDFLEGGDFSARAINNELDYLTASVQQVDRQLSPMLRYSDHENPAQTILPDRAARANKALGFDGDGNPVAVTLEGSMAAPDYTAYGTGAVTRPSSDKFSDAVSVKDFGAYGNGLHDDTIAIQKTLAAHDTVFLPPGSYLISGTITLGERQKLFGAGQVSVLQCQDNSFNAVEIVADFATVSDIRITGGAIGLKLFGRDRPCVQCAVTDVAIFAADIGVQLDGHNDPNFPCYWNNFDRVLVEEPAIHGIHLTRSGAGDTPNANKFHACRVYSHGADISGHGIYVEHGSFNNAFIDCEANVKGTAQGCMTMGAESYKTLLVNPYTESNNTVPNVKLEAGSDETSIFNLLSMSDGSAIWDLSGGKYTAYNAGFPHKNRLQRTTAVDINATLQRYDTEYIDTSGTVQLDISHSVHLVSSFGGALTLNLPNAADAVGVMMVVKKTDSSSNVITIAEDGGDGPDGRNYYLGAEGDFMQALSNGAEWFVISSNRAPGNTRYHDGSGVYDIDMAVDVYLVSSYGGAITARLPPANAAIAVGRTVTIKKTDVSSNVITVTEYGGSGPDGYGQPLNAQYNAITVVSDGAHWHIISKF
ncbi:MAG TPA: glycosyl hydrolase family 28-related protein [Micavibrio sp.]|nr:glycosyl hydrolase family 28-related protein [Micavibrio sp.]